MCPILVEEVAHKWSGSTFRNGVGGGRGVGGVGEM